VTRRSRCACDICGQPGKMSVEDAFPEWLRRKSRDWGGAFQTTTNGVRSESWHPTIVMRHRRWCVPCNNRVGRYNEKAIPLVEALVRGEQTRLEPNDQAEIAAWCWRTAVSIDAVDGRRDFPPTEPPRLHTAAVPDGLRVWLGDFNYEHPDVTTAATPRNTDYGRVIVTNSFGPMLTINRMLFLVLRSDDLGQFKSLATPAEDRGHVIRVWPAHKEAITWPPRWRFNKAGVDDLGRLYTSSRSQW
jgi:hypothetical protein